MIVIKLREAMQLYKRRTGRKMTYGILAAQSGISQTTIAKIGGGKPYNATLTTIDKICRVLAVALDDLLEREKDPHTHEDTTAGPAPPQEKPRRRAKTTRKKRKSKKTRKVKKGNPEQA